MVGWLPARLPAGETRKVQCAGQFRQPRGNSAWTQGELGGSRGEVERCGSGAGAGQLPDALLCSLRLCMALC